MTPAVLLMFLSMAAGVFLPDWTQKANNRATGLDAPSARPATEVGLTGCLEEGLEPGTFVLRDARQRPDDPLEKSADYLVTQVAPLELRLEAHVDHSVRLFGLIKEDALPSLNAKELRMAAETCAAEADDESEDSEAASSSSGGRMGFADLSSAGMPGGWPQMTGRLAGGSSLKSDLAPGLFAGITGGMGLVSGLGSSQKISAVDTGSPEIPIDTADPAQTSGWSGAISSGAPMSVLASLGNVPGSAGPTIAVNAAAADLGVDPSGAPDLFAMTTGPTPIPNPEPATLVMLGTGLLSVALAARRHRARRL